MINVDEKGSCGVIVGRFQVPFLHEAHKELIDRVVKAHPKVIIFLGLSPCLVTRNNPLDFEARRKMLQEMYPDAIILYIDDVPSDEIWSKKLDDQITRIISPNQSVVLYGGRDGFVKHYTGKFKTCELESTTFVSGTEIRNSISKSVKGSPDFRMGVIWAAYNQYPKVFTTVDIAIFNEDGTKILLGKKPNESKYRFIGGFSSPDSDSFEHDARREVQEETGVEIGDMTYVGSYKISDWRYANEIDKIKTILFKAKYIYGAPRAGDDIELIKWFDIAKLQKGDIVDSHHILFDALVEKKML